MWLHNLSWHIVTEIHHAMLICTVFPSVVEDKYQPLPENIPMVAEQENADISPH